jgi:hypothetical protein
LNFFADDPIDLPESIGQQKATLTEGECRSLLVLQREMTGVDPHLDIHKRR